MDCNTFKNLGAAACAYMMANAKSICIVPTVDSAGDANKFTTIGAVTKAALQAKFDAPNIKDRFFWVHKFEQVEQPKADNTNWESDTGTIVNLRQGPTSFTGWILTPHPSLVGKLEAFKGEDFGLLIGGEDHSLQYETDKATELEVIPIAVDGGSWDARYIKRANDIPEHIELTFNFSSENDDSLLRSEKWGNLDFDPLSLIDCYSLNDVTLSATFTSTTAVGTLTLVDNYGSPIEGLTGTDGLILATAVYNVTDSAYQVLTSVSETSAGVYALTYTASATASDALRANPVKSRFSFNELVGYSAIVA